MKESQGRNCITDPTELILWYVYLKQVLYYTRNQINHIISAEHIMNGLMNKTPMYHLSKITHQGPFTFNIIHKVFFGTTIYRLTSFHMNLKYLIQPL